MVFQLDSSNVAVSATGGVRLGQGNSGVVASIGPVAVGESPVVGGGSSGIAQQGHRSFDADLHGAWRWIVDLHRLGDGEESEEFHLFFLLIINLLKFSP